MAQRWGMLGMALAYGGLQATSAEAAALATGFLAPLAPYMTAFTALLWAIGVAVVVVGGIKASALLSLTDGRGVGEGVFGLLAAGLGGIFLFFIIPLITGGGSALGATLP